MASVACDPNRLKRVCFIDDAGKPQSIRLGRASVKEAESIKRRVEALLRDRRMNNPHDAEMCEWLRGLSSRLHKRLVRFGLAEPRTPAPVVTLGTLLERFEAAAAVKPQTLAAYRQAIASLRATFGDAKPLGELTQADADAWRKSIAAPATVVDDEGHESVRQLAPATVAKRTRVAKSIFRKAVRWGLMPHNPFGELRCGSQSNPARAHYVDAESIESILAACPNDEWRAIVALSRYAGLRCPSEVVELKWGDVNWDRGRLTVRSVKTADHEGHGVRVVPIAPELRPILLALFEAAEPGTEPIVPRLRDPRMNLRTTFGKIIARAGVTPWPRLFHNMRASCATDWVERFPAHVVAGWLGHSPLIAARHYLQTRDAHFELATGHAKGDAKSGAESGAPRGKQAARKAAQHPPASGRVDSPDASKRPYFTDVSRTDADGRERARNGARSGRMGWVGFEPTSRRL